MYIDTESAGPYNRSPKQTETVRHSLRHRREIEKKTEGGRDVGESGMSTGGIVHLHFKHKVS